MVLCGHTLVCPKGFISQCQAGKGARDRFVHKGSVFTGLSLVLNHSLVLLSTVLTQFPHRTLLLLLIMEPRCF